MKALVVCPNGELITPREKLVGMVLADSHQDKARRFTYPSVETIAEESRSDRRTCQRYLDALERKGVIRRLRPSNQGRGAQVFYFFPALDELPEGWQDAALLSQAAPDVFFGKGGGRAAEGRRKGGRADTAHIERAREREQKQLEQEQHPPTPLVTEGGGVEEESDAGKTEESAGELAKENLLAVGVVVVRERGVDDAGLGAGEGDTQCVGGAARGGMVTAVEAVAEDADLDGANELTAEDREWLEKKPESERGKWREYLRESGRKEREAAAEERKREAREAELRREYPDLERALENVRKQCGFIWSRDRSLARILRQVFEDRMQAGEPLWQTGPRMIRGWIARRKEWKYGPRVFFENGEWLKDSESG
jgi:hypothetical protein